MSRLGIGSKADEAAAGKRRNGPWNWGLFILLLWIIGFPAYLYHRSRYGVQNLLLPGLITAGCLIATPFFTGAILPKVDSPEVVALAQQVLQDSPILKVLGVDHATIKIRPRSAMIP